MAQLIESWFICGGRFRVHAVKDVGRRKARIIEVECIDSGVVFDGSPKQLQKLVDSLTRSAAPLVTVLLGFSEAPKTSGGLCVTSSSKARMTGLRFGRELAGKDQ